MNTPENKRLLIDSELTETNRLMAEVEQKIEWAFSLANDPDWQQNARSTLRLYSRWPLNFVDAQDVQIGRICDYGRRTLPQLICFAIDDAREQVPGFDFSLACFEAWASTKAGAHFESYASKYEHKEKTETQPKVEPLDIPLKDIWIGDYAIMNKVFTHFIQLKGNQEKEKHGFKTWCAELALRLKLERLINLPPDVHQGAEVFKRTFDFDTGKNYPTETFHTAYTSDRPKKGYDKYFSKDLFTV